MRSWHQLRRLHDLHHRRHDRHLRHRIFFSLGATIVLSVVVGAFVVQWLSSSESHLDVMLEFASDRFAAVWDDAGQRADLADSIERHFHVTTTVRDSSGSVLYRTPGTCKKRIFDIEVTRHAAVLGRIEGCVPAHGWSKTGVYTLLSVIVVLWIMSGFLARQLVRPLDELVRVVRDIGEGRLDARMQLCGHHHRGEVGEVADAVNAMAAKIEKQIAGQRELLAAVSHEIRSPLARLRMLVELERDTKGTDERLDSMDLELTEMDSLVGQLLAQSRLEFQHLERRTVGAGDFGRTLLERANLPNARLSDESSGAQISIDSSLFSRALLNVIDNAERHGPGLESLHIRASDGKVRFELCDRGPGFDPGMLERALEPFVGQRGQGGLGLGLSLVERIVAAHGGSVRLENRAEGGARVTVELGRVDAA